MGFPRELLGNSHNSLPNFLGNCEGSLTIPHKFYILFGFRLKIRNSTTRYRWILHILGTEFCLIFIIFNSHYQQNPKPQTIRRARKFQGKPRDSIGKV